MKKIKYLREISILSVLTIILIIIVVANKYVSSYYRIGEGYEWKASAGTTKDLPIMFAKCDLHYSGNYENGCESNVMLYGDGLHNAVESVSSGSSGIGDEKELYPNIFKILYYSFNEQKFYGGTFNLDYAKILATAEKMRNAVVAQEGTGKTQSINFITKVYPMGKVVVSMESYFDTSIGEVVIGNFQTKPENHDWSVMGSVSLGDNKTVSENPSVNIQRALLLHKYNWQIAVVLSKDFDFKSLDVDVYGSKSLAKDTLKNTKIPTFGNFVYLPKDLYLSWKRKDTIEYHTNFEFDEQEIIKSFETIDGKGNNIPITMQLIVKDEKTPIRAILNGNGKSIALKNKDTKAEIRTDKIYN